MSRNVRVVESGAMQLLSIESQSTPFNWESITKFVKIELPTNARSRTASGGGEQDTSLCCINRTGLVPKAQEKLTYMWLR